MVRLQKFLAEAGVASRRASEKIILDGRVAVNGRIVTELGGRVDPLHDSVEVDGQEIRSKRKLHIALHKPKGYITTRNREEGEPEETVHRKIIGDLLPKEWAHLFPVGRLDKDSEGLIFLTNDGDFCLKLTHPRYGILKTYVATLEGRVTPETVAKLLSGVKDRDETLKARKVRLISANNSHSVVELVLGEGKNREVRRMFEALGFTVNRLKRVKIGKIALGELPLGKWRTLTESEIKSLLSAL